MELLDDLISMSHERCFTGYPIKRTRKANLKCANDKIYEWVQMTKCANDKNTK